jgi:hypothetical protein
VRVTTAKAKQDNIRPKSTKLKVKQARADPSFDEINASNLMKQTLEESQ